MEHYTQAVVLNRFDVRAADRLFSLYTRHLGKTLVLGRGVRQPNSKMAGVLEPFAVVSVKIVHGKGGPTLSNVETLKRYQRILKNADCVMLAGNCLRLVDTLVKEGSCDTTLLSLITTLLAALDDPSVTFEKKKFLAAVWRLQLASHLGYRPELTVCVMCRSPLTLTGNSFDVRRGGVVCHRHAAATRLVTVNQIKLLRLILEQPLDFFMKKKLSKTLAQSIEVVMNEFVAVVGS